VNPDEESGLVRRAQDGDRVAYSALVARYWKPVHGWIAGLCGDDHLAEDITQNAFVRAWQALPQLNSILAFRVWLFRIARNEWRAGKRAKVPANDLTTPNELVDPSVGPVSETLDHEAEIALGRAIRKLGDLYRDAYLLWSYEQMPYSAIALVLDITEETARWRVCEARRRLVIDLQAFFA